MLTGSQIKNIQYAEVEGKPLLLDLYLPEKPDGSPLIVWIHGGGWKGGTKEKCFVTWLSNFGYTVASINYRLVDVCTMARSDYMTVKVLFGGFDPMHTHMDTVQIV